MLLDLHYSWINPYVCKFGLFQIISSIDELKTWLYNAPNIIALDFETCGDLSIAHTAQQKAWVTNKGGLDTVTCKVLLTALAYHDSAAVVDHGKVSVEETLKILKGYKLIMHNASFDAKIIFRITGEMPIIEADTIIMYGMVTAGIRPTWSKLAKLSLDVMCAQVLNIELDKTVRASFSSGFVDQGSIAYAAQDAYATFLCWEILTKKIEEMGLEYILSEIEMPLCYGLCKLEHRGVEIDYKEAKLLESRLVEREAIIEKELAEFGLMSPGSAVQVLKFFNASGIKTETAAHAFLEKIAPNNEAAALLLKYKSVNKFRTGFLVPWTGKHFNPYTKRLHPGFTQTFVETGRLSCREPNMQQIPKSNSIPELADIDIRGLISPGIGNTLVTADYSQYELRVLAELSNDKRMISEFQNEYEELLNLWEVMRVNGVHKWQSEAVDELLHKDSIAAEIKHKLKFLDKHTQTAATIFGIEADKVEKVQRTQAKAVSFGIVYGMGPESLAESLTISMGKKITTEYALKLLKKYFTKYPGIKSYIQRTAQNALMMGECSTPLGRMRRFPSVVGDNNQIKSSMKREAVNMTVQGSNGDVTKIALIDLFQTFDSRYPDIYPIMTIHDEIVTVCPKADGNDVAFQVERAMVDASGQILKRVPTSLGITLSDKWEKD